MSIPNGVIDVDLLISHLSRPLSPSARHEFRAAAMDALARVPCWGEGAVYRTLAALQRTYFTPPSDREAAWSIDDGRSNKLSSARPLATGRDLRLTKHFKIAG